MRRILFANNFACQFFCYSSVFFLLLRLLIILPNFKGRPPMSSIWRCQRSPLGLVPRSNKTRLQFTLQRRKRHDCYRRAYDDATIEKDLNIFSQQFHLPQCTTSNGCFAKHLMAM